MKRIVINISSLLSLFLLVAITGCKKDDRDINMNISDVTTFYAPNDNLFVKLDPASSASVGFEWDQARAEDGALVMYEVAFDKETGDLTNPIYKISSDGNGIQNRLTLSHKDLNNIAKLAGIEATKTGKLKWTVLAFKGTNVRKAALTRTIEVERPRGFTEIPSDVFLSGDGTEAGNNLQNALKMKSIGQGKFEIYTQLKPGTFRFVNNTTGTPTSYDVQGSLLKEGTGTASPAPSPTVYR
ncbi:MAG TPA: SusE domain-containing protein, partial [Flavisolibacter sp.]|nr:SusE domain-containing protein [Flavisolibacter sp.]